MSKLKRPNFETAWSAFRVVNVPVREVGLIIGGAVQRNIEIPESQGGFANACPIRMSYVMNRTGFAIQKSAQFKSVSGADHHQYLYHVKAMILWLELQFGAPDVVITSPKPGDLKGRRGILVVKGHGWGNATGHVTLWDGVRCADACHLIDDPLNGRFVPDSAALWILP